MLIIVKWWWQLPRTTIVLKRRWVCKRKKKPRNLNCKWISLTKNQKAASLSIESLLKRCLNKTCSHPNSVPNRLRVPGAVVMTHKVKTNSMRRAIWWLQAKISIWSVDEEVAWSKELRTTSNSLNSRSNKSKWEPLDAVAAKASSCQAL